MFKSVLAATAAAAMAMILSTAAIAASEDAKKAATLLFETPHIASVAPGTKFTYKNERVPSNEQLLGKGFVDDITVDVESDGAPGKKNAAGAGRVRRRRFFSRSSEKTNYAL